MVLKNKQKVVVQVYQGRKFGGIIGSWDILIGGLLDNGEYIDVPQERVGIVSVEAEKDFETTDSDWKGHLMGKFGLVN